MPLIYKGKPYRPANRQADDVPKVCFCKFVAVGEPVDRNGCEVHIHEKYKCGQCNCSNYRPNRVKTTQNDWPRCTCSHIAQEH